MSEMLLPPQAHALAASIEDGLSRWNRRGDSYMTQTEAIGEHVVRQLGDLLKVLGDFRDDVDDDVREYARRRTLT